MAKFTCPVCSKPSTKEGGCWKHAPRKPLKTSKLKKKPKTEEEKIKLKNRKEEDIRIYTEIWAERPHYCDSCDIYLGNEMKSYHIEHIIEKSKRPDLRHNKDNIALVCFECHQLKTGGFPTEQYKRIINKTKEKFGIIK